MDSNFIRGFTKEAIFSSVIGAAQKAGMGAAAKNYLGRLAPGRERAKAGLNVIKSLRQRVPNAQTPMGAVS